ncbi:hypothetical protein SNE40_010177 [Patella caerulea]|uniref:Transforming growth factor beta regulator 1 n=1 Tax=Patella caerulea TaxID=87958 RepID=A0AAN8JUQ3_PATCE
MNSTPTNPSIDLQRRIVQQPHPSHQPQPFPAVNPIQIPIQIQSSEALARLSLPGQFKAVRPNTGRSQDYYYRKWRKLKKIVKNTVFLNAAACDEVVRVEEKLAKVKEERRYLLRKLLQYQSLPDVTSPVVKTEPSSAVNKASKSPSSSVVVSEPSSTEVTVKVKPKKKLSAAAIEKKKAATTKEILESLQPKPKKSKSQNMKRTIPPIPLDSLGRPVFPMMMGDLTLHSIGEILSDKGNFHCTDSIYPVGYVSTRLYANMHNPDVKCMYTCKISDVSSRPVFDIAPDDSPEKIIRALTPDECIAQLIKIINKAKGTELAALSGNGLDFFGLSHPLVRNLIQSCPGAKKCPGYKWVKFEVNKNESLESIEHCTSDPVVHFDALKKILAQIGALKNPLLEQSSNLRSLLTSGPFSKPSTSTL